MVECDNLCTPSSSFTNNRREQYLAEMDHHMVDDITPTRILTIAIQKRREFVDQKEPNMRCELLNKSLIHHVCRTLGEHRSRKPSFIQQQRTGSTSKRRNRSSEDDDQGSKRFHVEEEEEEDSERLYVDDQAKEDFHHFLEEDDASSAYSMVHIELGGMNFDYNQIEKLLDEDQPVSLFHLSLLLMPWLL